MKWKNNIIVLILSIIGKIQALDEQFNKFAQHLDCQKTCSKSDSHESKILSTGICDCMDNHSDGIKPVAMVVNTETFDSDKNLEDGTKHKDIKRTKRETVKELISKRNRKSKILPNNIKFLSTEKPLLKFKAGKYSQKSQLVPKMSERLSNRQIPRVSNLEDRIKNLRARFPTIPIFHSRGAFSEIDRPKNLIKQLKDKREELLKDFKAHHPKALGKDANSLKEKVGSINYLQNRIDIGPNIKSRSKGKTDSKNENSETKTKQKESEGKENGGLITQSSTTEAANAASQIPVIVLGLTDTTTPKTEAPKRTKEKTDHFSSTDSSTKKIESVSSTLENIKEKQKEAVMKIKEKISSAKNKQNKIINIDK